MNRDDAIDEALEETFPASDAPGRTVETGVGIQPSAGEVYDNREAGRFELEEDDALAFLKYERGRDVMTLVHTEVPPSLRGRHLGDALVRAGLAAARAEGLRIVATCPFVRAYLRNHPDPAR